MNEKEKFTLQVFLFLCWENERITVGDVGGNWELETIYDYFFEFAFFSGSDEAKVNGNVAGVKYREASRNWYFLA